jgi:hypothetical protein
LASGCYTALVRKRIRGLARLTLATVFISLGTLGAAANRPTDAYRVSGLEQPAEILIDEWGVPHIYAKTHSAFFVQGFNAARDRLWQIDSWRRRGLGQLSSAGLQSRAGSRRAAVLYRGDMYKEWLAYPDPPSGSPKRSLPGINAFIDLTGATGAAAAGVRHAGLSTGALDRLVSCGFAATACGATSPMSRPRAHSLVFRIGGFAAQETRTCVDRHRSRRHRPLCSAADVLDVYLLAKAPISFANPANALARRSTRTSDGHRQQQLGRVSSQEPIRQADPRKRSASRPRRRRCGTPPK